MKAIFLGMLFISVTSQVNAQVPDEIQKLTGRQGILKSIYNGENFPQETGRPCRIEAESQIYEGLGRITSVDIDANIEMIPRASLEGAKRSVKGKVITYATTENGKRPGGSVCGDYTPLFSYKKSVDVEEKTLTITESFRCGFEKTEIILSCTVK